MDVKRRCGSRRACAWYWLLMNSFIGIANTLDVSSFKLAVGFFLLGFTRLLIHYLHNMRNTHQLVHENRCINPGTMDALDANEASLLVCRWVISK